MGYFQNLLVFFFSIYPSLILKHMMYFLFIFTKAVYSKNLLVL
jgi:hypothetical protein